MKEFASGAITMAYLVSGLFFLRFWKRTRDALFAFFCIAFWILALQRMLLSAADEKSEDNTLFYAIRLLAFLLIIAAIWQKNRSSRASSTKGTD